MARLQKTAYAPFPNYNDYGDVMKGFEAQDKALAELQKASDALPEGEIVGAVLSWPRGDGQAYYIVTKASPLTVAWIDAIDGWTVEAATIRGLTREDVLAQLWHRQKLTDLFSAGDRWWNEREIGETLHYHNSFGQFVRGTVVEHEGEKMLLPIALVGAWKKIDLPRRYDDGTILVPYHARKIAEGEPFRPHEANMYEHDSFRPNPKHRDFDPTTAEPIDLSVPEMTGAEEEIARLFGIAEAVIDTLDRLTSENVREKLDKAAKQLALRETGEAVFSLPKEDA